MSWSRIDRRSRLDGSPCPAERCCKKRRSLCFLFGGRIVGAFIPVSEDINISEAVRQGYLSLEKLEAMTAVCSVGLDMIAIPGKVDADTIAAILADEMAIGVVNHKTTGVRLIPVPGKDVGEKAVFGGLFGEANIMEVRNNHCSSTFVGFGGRIPAPITSINN